MVEVNCETDFVAKNDDFRAFASEVAADRRARESGRSRRAGRDGARLRRNASSRAASRSCRRSARTSRSAASRARVAKGRIASYVHGGKIGVLVDLTGGQDTLGKDLAMHVAASKPMAVAAIRCPPTSSQSERSIAAAQAAESGKPANIVEKMVEGGGREVPRRSHAAGAAVRQGRRQADGRASS